MARFFKGQSGNPRGRPQRGTAIAELARAQVRKYKLIEKLGRLGAASDEFSCVDVDHQLRAIQLLLSYGYGPPRIENERSDGIKIEVSYVEANQIAIAHAPSGAAPGDWGSQAVQRRLLRPPLGEDGTGDGPVDPSGSAR
jgi:hypothetical protein